MCQDEHPPFQTEDLSPELIDFMKNCFKKDPSVRPTAFELWNHPWIQKNRKPEKKEDWRKSVARIKIHNQEKNFDTLRSLKNIDWSSSPSSTISISSNADTSLDTNTSNSSNDSSNNITRSASTDTISTPNLRMGHRGSLILNGEEGISTNQSIEYIPMIVDGETAKNFLFSYTVC
jgi:serine/threonine protein kinase